MTDLTEYADYMINAVLDEWGNRKIDGILEDGTRIIIAIPVIPPVGYSYSDGLICVSVT